MAAEGSRGRLEGKLALVTGGAKRLGRSIVLELAKRGADVAIHYHSSAGEATDTARAIEALGRRAWTVRADLAEADEAAGLVAAVVAKAGRPVDVLVNSASVFGRSDLRTFTREELDRELRVNALAALDLSRAVAAQGREAAIVNLVDARVGDYVPGRVAYQLSKRMLLSLTRMMAVEFAPAVRVNAVAPGIVLPAEDMDAAAVERMARGNPLGRIGEAEDVAEAVAFLATSAFVTGQVLYVDGGRHLRGAADD